MKLTNFIIVCLLGIVITFSSCVTKDKGGKESKIHNMSSDELVIDKNEVRPNILYIFTDDQTIRTLGAYSQSHSWVETPNIDKLAEQGVMFQSSYTGAKCVPSRGNALTGMLQHNYTKETEYWPVEFRKQGYYTGMIGKWHWNIPRHDETWDWSAVWEHHLPENHHNYYWDQSLRMNGDTLLKLEKYSTDAYTDLTINFIEERAKTDKPWYFWLCYSGVHGPYTPADRHINDYANAPEIDIPVDVFGPRPEKPEYLVDMSMFEKDKDGKPIHKNRSLDSWVKQYNEAVKSIDEGVGRILSALEKTGQRENTVIIFTSDNGFAWGQHGFRLKLAPYDANLLTPLIVSQPNRFPENEVCEYPVNGVDIIKTIHSLTGVKPSNQLDGRDISDLLLNPNKEKWDSEPMIQIYTGKIYGGVEEITRLLKKAHKTGDWKKFVVHKTGIPAWMMLRKDKYKYVRYIYKNYIEELYDLENDPDELHNLAIKKEYHDLLAEYRKETEELFKAKGATFIDLMPEPKLVSE